ncbi:glycosyltransferase [Rhodococcus rhodochrous]|uniref:glycosyltransferase family 2 protein n=1 Tax=Rhodococcus rhodochrous TaxID=1829 RepID=UPI003557D628|nr:glycosyltransferase [Rhodococcus rhodochrous]
MTEHFTRIHLISACHNRKALTVSCLSSAISSAHHAGLDIDITLFDDGSTDGTSDTVRAIEGAQVEILVGDGSAYWAASMSRAEEFVLSRSDVSDSDVLLWLNDDTHLYIDAIGRLRDTLVHYPHAIVAASVVEPDGSEEISYGGYVRSGTHPLRYSRILPHPQRVQEIDAFNGNCVCLSVGTARRMGGIDGSYAHSLADIDYGIRALSLEIPVLIAPGVFGSCHRDIRDDSALGVTGRWKSFVGIKGGGHYRSLRTILEKTSPRTWPMFIIITYSKWWFRELAGFVIPKKSGSE